MDPTHIWSFESALHFKVISPERTLPHLSLDLRRRISALAEEGQCSGCDHKKETYIKRLLVTKVWLMCIMSRMFDM